MGEEQLREEHKNENPEVITVAKEANSSNKELKDRVILLKLADLQVLVEKKEEVIVHIVIS